MFRSQSIRPAVLAVLLLEGTSAEAGSPHVLSLDIVRFSGPVALLAGIPDGGRRTMPRDQAALALAKAIEQGAKSLASARIDVVPGEKVVPFRKTTVRSYVEYVAEDGSAPAPRPRTLQTGLVASVVPDRDGTGFAYEWKDTELVGPVRGFRDVVAPDGHKSQVPVLREVSGSGHDVLPSAGVDVSRQGNVLAFAAWD